MTRIGIRHVLVPIVAIGAIKLNLIGEPEAGQGTEGGTPQAEKEKT
jgi:hypothetical protein